MIRIEYMESSAIKFCARHKVRKPQTHRMEARRVFILLIKKKRKGKKLVSKTKRHGGNPREIPPVPFQEHLQKPVSSIDIC